MLITIVTMMMLVHLLWPATVAVQVEIFRSIRASARFSSSSFAHLKLLFFTRPHSLLFQLTSLFFLLLLCPPKALLFHFSSFFFFSSFAHRKPLTLQNVSFSLFFSFNWISIVLVTLSQFSLDDMSYFSLSSLFKIPAA